MIAEPVREIPLGPPLPKGDGGRLDIPRAAGYPGRMPPRVVPAPRRLARGLCAALLLALAACAGTRAAAGPERPGARARGGPLRVASSPIGARVMLDGAATNFRTPTTIAGLAPGRHRLELTLHGHRNWVGEVAVEAAAGTSVAATLLPLATGSIAVESVPSGAALSIDGQDAALATPALVSRLPVGTHTVQLRRDGYEVWSQAVVVMQDRRLALAAVLAPDRSRLGHLAVQSRPARGRIALDGYPTGKLTPDTLYGLQPGAHRVEITREGHRTWRGEATVREGRTADLLVTLQRAEPQKVGSARIESDPPGAAISLGGVPLRRKTPAEIDGLAAGSHPIEISRPGSRAWQGELTVAPGECTVLAVKLQPEARAGLVPPPFAISARVAAEGATWCDLEIEARRTDGSPAAGSVGLDLAAEGARRIERTDLAAGGARVRVPLPPGAAEVGFSVLLGDQRELFLLRRAPAGCEVRASE